jgi:hypothetical protein
VAYCSRSRHWPLAILDSRELIGSKRVALLI